MGNLFIRLFIPIILLCNHLYAQPTTVYYLRANIGEPWPGWAPVANTNTTEMDAVFGAGGWILGYYETAIAATIFSTNTCYVYMEGGDAHAIEMETFFSANKTTIENWVSSGGSLFMNAAPNEGDGMSYGFGGVNLIYSYFSSSVVVHPTATAHPIWSGPYTPVITSYSGTSYTHARVASGGTSPIIKDAYASPIALAEKTWGAGRVFFGGMTVTGWHSPFTEASNLRKNMHSYLSGLCNLILLPVEFTDFNAIEENETVLLNWNTANELNNDFFTVERSADGINWSKITIVEGAGTSSVLNNYTIVDENPILGSSYYKIKQTDFNGNSTYSTIEEININNDVIIYPVPAFDQVQIQFKKFDGNLVTILNTMGEKLNCEQTINYNSISIDLKNIPAGVYYVQSNENNNFDMRKFIKR